MNDVERKLILWKNEDEFIFRGVLYRSIKKLAKDFGITPVAVRAKLKRHGAHVIKMRAGYASMKDVLRIFFRITED